MNSTRPSRRQQDEQGGDQDHAPSLHPERVGCEAVDHTLNQFQVLDLAVHSRRFSGVERVIFLSIVAYSRQSCSGDYARKGGGDQPSDGSRRNLDSAAVKGGRVAAQSWGRGHCSESSGIGLAPGSAGSWFGAVGCAGAGFPGGAAGVQFQEAGEDFVAGRGRVSDRISSSRPRWLRRSRGRGGIRSQPGCRASRRQRGQRGPWRRGGAGARRCRDRHHRGRGSAVVGLGHAIAVSAARKSWYALPVASKAGWLQVFREGECLEAVGGGAAEASIPNHCATSQIQADYEEMIHILRLHSVFYR